VEEEVEEEKEVEKEEEEVEEKEEEEVEVEDEVKEEEEVEPRIGETGNEFSFQHFDIKVCDICHCVMFGLILSFREGDWGSPAVSTLIYSDWISMRSSSHDALHHPI